jgi:hypothetical protein
MSELQKHKEASLDMLLHEISVLNDLIGLELVESEKDALKKQRRDLVRKVNRVLPNDRQLPEGSRLTIEW